MNIFKQLIKSIHSPKHIAAFRFQGIGKTILYIFLLSFLSVIPRVIELTSFSTDAINDVQDALEHNIPSFTIKDGKLESESKEPIIIEKPDMTIVFDSTGDTEAKDMVEEEKSIAFLKDSIVVNLMGSVEWSYSMIGAEDITKDQALSTVNMMDSLKLIFLPVAMISVYLFSSAVMFLKIMIFALIATAFATAMQKRVNYRQGFRITAYAATLSTLFFAIMELLKTPVPAAPFVDWFVITVIIYLSVKEIPQRKA
ncbi:DUF1189 domain-containing protein [Rossellomorea marisflavi]|uniref:DUF1189 domain-containing protein n=1 Tax=Rossellomorea marisflavi TaxID=189381 RepID=UPI00203CABCA|nr:DUF1189 domain-containing protein [Rossellomorea marisflavi]MCM2606106.1 DUF1189 domain-containing protein [Rossellomorea marisflavi]